MIHSVERTNLRICKTWLADECRVQANPMHKREHWPHKANIEMKERRKDEFSVSVAHWPIVFRVSVYATHNANNPCKTESNVNVLKKILCSFTWMMLPSDIFELMTLQANPDNPQQSHDGVNVVSNDPVH